MAMSIPMARARLLAMAMAILLAVLLAMAMVVLVHLSHIASQTSSIRSRRSYNLDPRRSKL